MYISKISYRRTFNLGNYESETIELTADLSAEDNFHESMEKLKVMVHNQSMNALMETRAHDGASWEETDLLTNPRL